MSICDRDAMPSSWSEIHNQIVQWIADNQSLLNYDPKRTCPEQVAARYLAATQQAVIAGLSERTIADFRFNCYRISRRSLRVAVGRYGPRRSYWWDQLHQRWPLFKEIRRGRPCLNKQQRELTQIEPVIAEITEYSAASIEREARAAAENRDQFDWIAIDIDSLNQYIEQSTVPHYRQVALSIRDKYYLNHNSFPQSYRTAVSGRRYYQGLNLQLAPAVVRKAALGRHYEYDLNTSVYSWQIVILRRLYNLSDTAIPPGTSYTREYIANKNTIRKRLSLLMTSAKSSEEQIRRVKQAITAIGFGARRSNAFYIGEDIVAHGLAGVILNREDRERFLADSWVQGFLQEQTAIVQRIVEGYLEILPDNRTDERFYHKGKFSPKRYIAMLYQLFETRAMTYVQQEAADREVLLWVHDCVYTRLPVDLARINSLLKLEFGDGIYLVEQENPAWTKPLPSQEQLRSERALDQKAELLWHQASGRTTELNGQNSSELQPWRFQADSASSSGHYSGTNYTGIAKQTEIEHAVQQNKF